MIKAAKLALGLLMLAPVTTGASANSIDDRREHQADRIEHGRQTGAITWTEGLKLRAEQRKIAATESRLKAKGYLTRSDRRELASMQKDASENIHAKAHNGWHRLWWAPRVGQ